MGLTFLVRNRNVACGSTLLDFVLQFAPVECVWNEARNWEINESPIQGYEDRGETGYYLQIAWN